MGTPTNPFLDQRVLGRVRAEYLEMPGMKLTREQVQRLCGVEPSVCIPVLDSLVTSLFLRLSSDGRYVRLTEGSVLVPRPAKTALLPIAVVSTRRRAS